jgi:hypothetical protein
MTDRFGSAIIPELIRQDQLNEILIFNFVGISIVLGVLLIASRLVPDDALSNSRLRLQLLSSGTNNCTAWVQIDNERADQIRRYLKQAHAGNVQFPDRDFGDHLDDLPDIDDNLELYAANFCFSESLPGDMLIPGEETKEIIQEDDDGLILDALSDVFGDSEQTCLFETTVTGRPSQQSRINTIVGRILRGNHQHWLARTIRVLISSDREPENRRFERLGVLNKERAEKLRVAALNDTQFLVSMRLMIIGDDPTEAGQMIKQVKNQIEAKTNSLVTTTYKKGATDSFLPRRRRRARQVYDDITGQTPSVSTGSTRRFAGLVGKRCHHSYSADMLEIWNYILVSGEGSIGKISESQTSTGSPDNNIQISDDDLQNDADLSGLDQTTIRGPSRSDDQ